MWPRELRFVAALLTLVCGPAVSDTSPGTPARLWQVVNTAQSQGFAGEVLVADADSVWFEHAVGLARRKPDDGYLRETFTLPRDIARTRARDFLNRYPKAAYMSAVESWRELPGGDIEFTMRRLASAD